MGVGLALWAGGGETREGTRGGSNEGPCGGDVRFNPYARGLPCRRGRADYGNWKLRTASVDRLVVSRDSIEKVCAFYASKLKERPVVRWHFAASL